MLTIGICDNNCEHIKLIKDVLWSYLYSKDDIQINEYKDGTTLINHMLSGAVHLDLLILEINLPDINGLNLADIIKRNSIKTTVIVFTETDKYVFEGYKYNLFDYILKTKGINNLRNCIERYAYEYMDSTVEYLCIKTRGCVQHIKLNKVDYFENRSRKIAAISEDEEFEFYLQMDELINALPQDRFVRCHQSYVVNIRSIQSFTHLSVLIKNCFNIPVSRKYYSNLKQIMDKMLIVT